VKYAFETRYEIDAPLAITVATYLDSEHYVYLHRALSNRIEIIQKGSDSYRCHQTWNLFGLGLGQTYTCRYIPPATFINEDLMPYPFWFPSIHHVIHTKTELRYYETPRRTTLSELKVEMDIPRWLFPFRVGVRKTVEKIKILKDLEDVALIDRRARLFGRENNGAYLKRHQFMLHKEEYLRYFGEKSQYLGDPQDIARNETWCSITGLDLSYVRDFLRTKYHRYAGYDYMTGLQDQIAR